MLVGTGNTYHISFGFTERRAGMISYCDLCQLSGFTYTLSKNIKLEEIKGPSKRWRDGKCGEKGCHIGSEDVCLSDILIEIL